MKKKEPVKASPKKAAKGITVITPEEVRSEKIIVNVERPTKEKAESDPTFGKVQVLTKIPIPDGCIRCEVMQDYKGMIDELYAGDIIDLPERRYKTLSFRGLVKEYKGGLQPNKRR